MTKVNRQTWLRARRFFRAGASKNGGLGHRALSRRASGTAQAARTSSRSGPAPTARATMTPPTSVASIRIAASRAADVRIAMGGGMDVALEAADAAAMRNIRQNIAIALGLKAVFLVTTLLWPAILADTGATVNVTANATRLLRWRTST